MVKKPSQKQNLAKKALWFLRDLVEYVFASYRELGGLAFYFVPVMVLNLPVIFLLSWITSRVPKIPDKVAFGLFGFYCLACIILSFIPE